MKYGLQDPHLQKLRDDRTSVAVVLTNGIKLYGHLESFDQFSLMVTGEVPQMVYKSVVAYIQVARPNTFQHPRSGMTSAPRREFNPITRGGDEVQVPAPHKEPVVIVRKKLRTLAPESADSK